MHVALDNDLWKEAFAEWVTTAEPTSNRAFELLNFSFNTSGFFLIIPKNTVLDKPIEIRIIHDDPELSFSHPLYFIRCGASSQVEIIERFESNTKSSFPAADGLINSLCYFYLEPNSIVRHIKWQDLPLTQHLVYKLFVSQQRDSHFETLAFDLGGKLVRNNVEVELEGQNTYTSLQAGFMASGQQGMDHQTRINHKSAHCESHELYKGIIDDQASRRIQWKSISPQGCSKNKCISTK